MVYHGIPTPPKNDGVKVSWDDDIPNMIGKIKARFQTTNQVAMILNQPGLHLPSVIHRCIYCLWPCFTVLGGFTGRYFHPNPLRCCQRKSFWKAEEIKIIARPRENSKLLVLKGRQSLEQDRDKGLHCPSLPRNHWKAMEKYRNILYN